MDIESTKPVDVGSLPVDYESTTKPVDVAASKPHSETKTQKMGDNSSLSDLDSHNVFDKLK